MQTLSLMRGSKSLSDTLALHLSEKCSEMQQQTACNSDLQKALITSAAQGTFYSKLRLRMLSQPEHYIG